MIQYCYLGDRNTDPALKKSFCTAILRADGKCIRGRNGSMLVMMENGKKIVVIGRLLRKVKYETKLTQIHQESNVSIK